MRVDKFEFDIPHPDNENNYYNITFFKVETLDKAYELVDHVVVGTDGAFDFKWDIVAYDNETEEPIE